MVWPLGFPVDDEDLVPLSSVLDAVAVKRPAHSVVVDQIALALRECDLEWQQVGRRHEYVISHAECRRILGLAPAALAAALDDTDAVVTIGVTIVVIAVPG